MLKTSFSIFPRLLVDPLADTTPLHPLSFHTDVPSSISLPDFPSSVHPPPPFTCSDQFPVDELRWRLLGFPRSHPPSPFPSPLDHDASSFLTTSAGGHNASVDDLRGRAAEVHVVTVVEGWGSIGGQDGI